MLTEHPFFAYPFGVFCGVIWTVLYMHYCA